MNNTNRFEKLEWLQESCSEEFIKHHLITEMVNWMGEDDFTEFYQQLCRHWDIKSPEELVEEGS